MNYAKTLEELFQHELKAREIERRLLDSRDHAALSAALCAAVKTNLAEEGTDAEDRLALLAGLLPHAGTAEAFQALFELTDSEVCHVAAEAW